MKPWRPTAQVVIGGALFSWGLYVLWRQDQADVVAAFRGWPIFLIIAGVSNVALGARALVRVHGWLEGWIRSAASALLPLIVMTSLWLAADNQRLDGEVTEAERAAESAQDQARRAEEDLNERMDGLLTEREALKSKLHDLDLRLASERSKCLDLGAGLEAERSRHEVLRKKQTHLTSENRSLERIVRELRAAARDMQGALGEGRVAARRAETLRSELESAQDELRLRDAELAEARSEMQEIGHERDLLLERLAEIMEKSTSDGLETLVLRSGEDGRLVTLGAGTGDGVKKGMEFRIFRGKDVIALARVIHVDDEECVVALTKRHGDAPRPGDLAVTRLASPAERVR